MGRRYPAARRAPYARKRAILRADSIFSPPFTPFPPRGAQRDLHDGRLFEVELLLYPGSYEIKFIVDGTWRCEGRYSTVHAPGLNVDNNLLVVGARDERKEGDSGERPGASPPK